MNFLLKKFSIVLFSILLIIKKILLINKINFNGGYFFNNKSLFNSIFSNNNLIKLLGVISSFIFLVKNLYAVGYKIKLLMKKIVSFVMFKTFSFSILSLFNLSIFSKNFLINFIQNSPNFTIILLISLNSSSLLIRMFSLKLLNVLSSQISIMSKM